jgi:hypothetical protein
MVSFITSLYGEGEVFILFNRKASGVSVPRNFRLSELLRETSAHVSLLTTFTLHTARTQLSRLLRLERRSGLYINRKQYSQACRVTDTVNL